MKEVRFLKLWTGLNICVLQIANERNVIEDFQVSFNSPVMLTDNHMNIILYQIFSSTIYILLSSFLLLNLLLKALKNYNLPFSKLQHGLCKPTRTQTNVGKKIKM